MNSLLISKLVLLLFSIGNELCGSGVGARVGANQYAIDTINLRNIVNRVYKNVSPMPLVIGPGGFFEVDWFTEYLNKAENSLNATTRHIYDLGPGNPNTQLSFVSDPAGSSFPLPEWKENNILID